MTREEARNEARKIIQFYNATMVIDDKASVSKGTKKSVDSGLAEQEGYWVECKVFVPSTEED